MKKLLICLLAFVIELGLLLPIITTPTDIFFDIMDGNALTANRNTDQIIFAISLGASIMVGRMLLKSFDKLYESITEDDEKHDGNK